MDIPVTGTVSGLTRYREKSADGESLEMVELLEGLGMAGDFHANGGERQISLISQDAALWIRSQANQGLCFKRFRENLRFSGIPANMLAAGARLKVGKVLIEISRTPKHCYPECTLFSDGHDCRLSEESLFAKVIKGGDVRIGDEIHPVGEDEPRKESVI